MNAEKPLTIWLAWQCWGSDESDELLGAARTEVGARNIVERKVGKPLLTWDKIFGHLPDLEVWDRADHYCIGPVEVQP